MSCQAIEMSSEYFYYGKNPFYNINLSKQNLYIVCCQSLVSNPARLSILTTYEIDPGYGSSVI